MIPMSCPSCGRRGNVPLDRLNTRMHCKKCDAVFHLDATGKPVLGEPKAVKGGKSGASKGRDKNEPTDYIGIVAGWLVRVPRGVYLTLLAIGAAGLLYVVYASAPAPKIDFETAVRSKAEEVAQAFLNKDAEALRKLATGDTRDEAANLLDQFRSELHDSGLPSDKKVYVMVGLPNDESDQPRIRIDFMVPALDPTKEAPPPMYLDTLWYRDKNKWYLNGKGSVEENKTRVQNEKLAAQKKK